MHICTIVATRNKSVHVRTLHTLLQLNMVCMQHGVQQEITFIKDDPFEKSSAISRKLKTCDRILFIDYAIQIDRETIPKIFEKVEGWNCLVFPCVTEGINWSQFKTKVKSGSTEPIEQMGLEFDTEVGAKISDGIYKVKKTNPKCWVMETKSVLKLMKEKKGEGLKLPSKNDELFEKMLQKNVKIAAYTKANIQTIFSHECLGNILNASGVTQKATPS